jgi:hypothetical protein
MASNLAGNIYLGQYNACLLRAAKLDTDCSPLGTADSAIVTTGLVTMTASPEIEEGTVYEPKTGCGDVAFTIAKSDVIKRYNLTGEFIFFDFELMEILFRGSTVVGGAGSDFTGEVIGHAMPNYTDTTNNGVYLEVITQAAGEGAGDCVTSGGGYPSYIGYIFGKVKLAPGDTVLEEDVARLTFAGKAVNNPALYDGPWNDWPGTGYIPNSPLVRVGYSSAEYAAILATAGAGYKTPSVAS